MNPIWGEFLGTFILLFVFLSVNDTRIKNRVKNVGPIAIAFSVYIAGMSIGELSGGGFNPARSLGPAIVVGSIG